MGVIHALILIIVLDVTPGTINIPKFNAIVYYLEKNKTVNAFYFLK